MVDGLVVNRGMVDGSLVGSGVVGVLVGGGVGVVVGVSLVLDVGDVAAVAVGVSLVVDDLGATIGQSDGVGAGHGLGVIKMIQQCNINWRLDCCSTHRRYIGHFEGYK